jgi:hypothetical protein
MGIIERVRLEVTALCRETTAPRCYHRISPLEMGCWPFPTKSPEANPEPDSRADDLLTQMINLNFCIRYRSLRVGPREANIECG